MAKVELEFLGGAKEVGRSSTLIESPSSRIILDCRLKRGTTTYYPFLEGLEKGSINFVILTHAHIDHSGALPFLLAMNKLKEDAKIYCTTPTASLLKVLLWDSNKLQKSEWISEGKAPLYEEQDIKEVFSRLKTVSYDSFVPCEGILARFGDAGHILGSGWVSLEIEGIRITFSGDLGEGRSNHLNSPEKPPRSESLSWNLPAVQQGSITAPLASPIELIGEPVPSLVLVAAVGKSAEILRLLKLRKKSDLDLDTSRILYDGMISSVLPTHQAFANSIYMNESVAKEMKDSWEIGHFLARGFGIPKSLGERRYIAREQKSPKIAAPSGMLEGGQSTYYLRQFVERREEARIILLGYQGRWNSRRILQEAFESGGDAIPPLDDGRITSKIVEYSEAVCRVLGLLGSNGVGFVLADRPYLVEVNPRFQGIIDCVEGVLGINMVEEHIRTCRGELGTYESADR